MIKKSLLLSLFLLLVIIQLPGQYIPSSDSLLTQFHRQVEVSGNLIREKHPLANKSLDSLKAMSVLLDQPYSTGITLRVEAEKQAIEGKLDLATASLEKARKIIESCCPNSQEMVNILFRENNLLINLGLVNFDTIHFQKGRQKIEDALNISRELMDTTRIIDCLDALGDYFYYSAFQVEDLDSARHYYTKALSIGEGRTKDLYRLTDALHGLAVVNYNSGSIELAESYFDRSMALSIEHEFYDISYALHNDFAEKHDRSGDYEKALDLKLRAYTFALQSANIEFINRADRQLYRTYKSMGDYQKALGFYENYHDSIAVMNKQEAIALKQAIEIQDGVAKKEKAIIELELKSTKNKRNFLILLGLSSFIIAFVAIWANISLRKKNKALEAQKKEIILAQLLGQNNERRRMAGELHDNLNTKIAATRWQVEALQVAFTGENRERLDKINFQLHDLYEDVRLIAQNLMPDVVEEIGLINSLSNLFDSLNGVDKVNFHLVTELKGEDFSRQISYPIYNVIFEMINNILKHARAENAWISISKNKNEKIIVSVNDDGIGFSEDNIVKGFGLKNIRARVDNLNGHWQIESAPGKGTKILIEIPDIY